MKNSHIRREKEALPLAHKPYGQTSHSFPPVTPSVSDSVSPNKCRPNGILACFGVLGKIVEVVCVNYIGLKASNKLYSRVPFGGCSSVTHMPYLRPTKQRQHLGQNAKN